MEITLTVAFCHTKPAQARAQAEHDAAANGPCFKAQPSYGQSVLTASPRPGVPAGAGGATGSSPGW